MDELDLFFDSMSKDDPNKNTPFSVEVATETLEFLDLELKYNKDLNKYLLMCLVTLPTVLHMLCLGRVFYNNSYKALFNFALLLVHFFL